MARYVSENGTQHPGGRLYWGALKEFADGSLGSRTALFHEPYADDSSSRGLATAELSRMEEQALGAHLAGLQAQPFRLLSLTTLKINNKLLSPQISPGLDSNGL